MGTFVTLGFGIGLAGQMWSWRGHIILSWSPAEASFFGVCQDDANVGLTLAVAKPSVGFDADTPRHLAC